MRLIGFAIYLGIGAMLHALFVGAHFDWSSAWTIGWLVGWPIMLFIAGGAIMAGLAMLALVLALGIWLYDQTWPWRQRRAMKRKMAEMKKRVTP